MRVITAGVAAALFMGLAPVANAAHFNFNYLYDGSTLSLSPPDTPNGTTLAPGDTFTLTLFASLGDYWEVTSEVDKAFVPLSFPVSESGDRTATVETTWYLGASSVASRTDTGIVQSEIHVGAEYWDLAVGTKFDEVVMQYSLTSAYEPGTTTDTTTTIDQASSPFVLQDSHTFFAGGPSSGTIDYVSAVPLPAGMALYLPVLLIGGVAACRRRRARA